MTSVSKSDEIRMHSKSVRQRHHESPSLTLCFRFRITEARVQAWRISLARPATLGWIRNLKPLYVRCGEWTSENTENSNMKGSYLPQIHCQAQIVQTQPCLHPWAIETQSRSFSIASVALDLKTLQWTPGSWLIFIIREARLAALARTRMA